MLKPKFDYREDKSASPGLRFRNGKLQKAATAIAHHSLEI